MEDFFFYDFSNHDRKEIGVVFDGLGVLLHRELNRAAIVTDQWLVVRERRPVSIAGKDRAVGGANLGVNFAAVGSGEELLRGHGGSWFSGLVVSDEQSDDDASAGYGRSDLIEVDCDLGVIVERTV